MVFKFLEKVLVARFASLFFQPKNCYSIIIYDNTILENDYFDDVKLYK